MHDYRISLETYDTHIVEFLQCVANEVQRAREKYPTNKHVLHALSEESGKVVQAALDHVQGKASEHQVRKECVQAAAMAARFYLEGDECLPYIGVSKVPPATPVIEQSSAVPMAMKFPRYDQMEITWLDDTVTVISDATDKVILSVYAAMREGASLPDLYHKGIRARPS